MPASDVIEQQESELQDIAPVAKAGSTSQASSAGKGRSFAGDAFKLASSAAIAQIISFLVSPILSRLFAPDAFGTAAVFGSLLQVCTVVACLRYEMAIMLPERDKDAGSLLLGSLLITVGLAALTAIGVFLWGSSVAVLLHAPALDRYLWLLPIALFFNGSYLALRYWNTRARRFGSLAATRVAASTGQATVKLGAGLLGFVYAGSLIWARVFSTVVSAMGLAWRTWRDDRRILADIKPREIAKQFNRYRKFPLVSTWSGLLNTLSSQLPIMLLSAFFSQTTVGYYSFGLRVMSLPMGLVGDAIAQVFFQRASQARNEGTLQRVVQSTYTRLTSVSVFPLLVLALIGPEVFSFVFGSKWSEAGAYVQILSLWQFFAFLSSPMSTLATVVERLELGLALNVIILASRVLSLLIGGWLNDAILAMALYSVSGMLTYGWLLVWLLRVSGASVRLAVSDTLRCLLYATPALVVLAVVKWQCHWPDWSILVLACMGGVTYYGIILYQDRTLLEPLSIITRRFK